MTKEQLLAGIYWGYSGCDKMYRVYMPEAGEVYCTASETDRQMFIAKLKAEILLMGSLELKR